MSQPPRLLVLVLLLLLCGCGAVAAPRPTRAPASAETALTVLGDWDDARAAAWAAGDPVALGDLYVPGSRAGDRDVRSLRAYADRGLRVSGLRLQRLGARVLAKRVGLLRLEVVERLLAAEVLGGAEVRRLPAGQPGRRVLELRYVDGAWLMDRVELVTR